MFKFILAIILLMISNFAYSTCTSPLSRSDNSANTILTSAGLNADFNQILTHVNEIDGDCLEDATVPQSAFDSTVFPILDDAVKEGCRVSKSDDATLIVGACDISIDGNFVQTSTGQTVTWGGSSDAEAANTKYYLYTQSSTTNLDLIIKTSTPSVKGLLGTSRVLASFYNDGNQNITEGSIENWVTVDFVQQAEYQTCEVDNSGTPAINGGSTLCEQWVSSLTDSGVGESRVVFIGGTFTSTPNCVCNNDSGSTGSRCSAYDETLLQVKVQTVDNPGTLTDYGYDIICIGVQE